MVFIKLNASAPASADALAITWISVTFGVNLTINGLVVRLRTNETTVAAACGSVPKTMPPCFTLGQEIFISNAATPGTSLRRAATSPYSSWVFPKKLTITGVSYCDKNAILSLMKASIPTFCRPIALSIPLVVSQIRGVLLPAFGFNDIPLVTMAPS